MSGTENNKLNNSPVKSTTIQSRQSLLLLMYVVLYVGGFTAHPFSHKTGRVVSRQAYEQGSTSMLANFKQSGCEWQGSRAKSHVVIICV